MRLTAALAQATRIPRQRARAHPLDLSRASAQGDPEQLRAKATALGVLRAQQGHAIGSVLDEIAALRRTLRERSGSGYAEDAQLVDELLSAACTGYVEELTAMLQSHATRDPLTALPNRAAFTEVLTHEIAGATRAAPPALLLVDLDGFKGVNDTDGHLAGDAVLRAVADVLRDTARRSDIACRLGGDEFAVVLPRTSQRQAMQAARRLLSAARAASGLSSASARVTFSLGVGWLADPASLEELVAVADAALYRAKARGGDDVESNRPDDRPTSPA